MILRPYQQTALDGVRAAYGSGKRRILLCSPTGSGKSAMTRYMLGRTKKRVLILEHREELVEMIAASLGMPHGVVAGGRRTPDEQILVGMMQTVARRLDDLPKFDWVISDEAHLAMAPTWQTILRYYGAAWHLGMSASPCRLDGVGLGTVYEQIVYGPSVAELVSRGFLVPARVFAPTEGGAPKKSGHDFNMEAAADELDRPAITGSAIAHYNKLAAGRRAIAFCCNRAHAEHVAAEFRAAGIPALAVDGSMPDRKQRIAEFRSGRVRVLTNVELLTTGYDDPEIACEIMLRPTDSLALFLQMIGRVLRIHPGKRDAIILDHVGNTLRHGMPDQAREFSLDGSPKKSAPAAVRQCNECYAVFAPAPRCPSCGVSLAVPVRAGARRIEQRDGDLAEITEAPKRQAVPREELARMTAAAKTLPQLHALAKQLGFKAGWVWGIHASRQKRGRRAA